MKIDGPLIVGEETTKEVFGDYVSIYEFQQSIEDGATVPLYDEYHTPELQLVDSDLNDDIYDLIGRAELYPEQEARIEKELSRQYHHITRDDRLDSVAKDIVRYFIGRWFQGCSFSTGASARALVLRYDWRSRMHLMGACRSFTRMNSIAQSATSCSNTFTRATTATAAAYIRMPPDAWSDMTTGAGTGPASAGGDSLEFPGK